MQNSLDYHSTRPDDLLELTRPVLRRPSREIEIELVDADLIDDDAEVIEPVAPLDDPWFADDGDDVDDGVYWEPEHSYRLPVAVGLSAIAAVAAAIVF